ncbi:IS3 family transposase [Pectinatus frisingensis]|uniref:IS3 family transposase n=1 Tax=Pectinatus frisingensis TaxID=865 RepID=UPI0039BFE42E
MPHDNAVAENFFNCLKCEFVHFQHFHTRKEAAVAIFRYIEAYSNSIRPYSGLGWIAPNSFEKMLSNASA